MRDLAIMMVGIAGWIEVKRLRTGTKVLYTEAERQLEDTMLIAGTVAGLLLWAVPRVRS